MKTVQNPEHIEKIRQEVMRFRELLDVMTTALVNKILHAPIARLKQQDRQAETFDVDAVRMLFDLEEPDDT